MLYLIGMKRFSLVFKALGVLCLLSMTACLEEKQTENGAATFLNGTDAYFEVMEDAEVSGQLTASGPLSKGASFAIFSDPKKGRVEISSKGIFTYRPFANETGHDTFYFVAKTKERTSESVPVSIEITPVNDLPVANIDRAVVAEDASVLVDVLLNDSDVENSNQLRVSSVDNGSQGTTEISPDGKRVRYTPAASYAGSDSFRYRIRDEEGAIAEAQVTVTVNSMQDGPPVTKADTEEIEEDAKNPVVIDVLANDTDPDNVTFAIDTLTIDLIPAQPAGGTASIANGKIEYLPKENFSGIDTFVYIVGDGAGGVAQGTVSVNVINSNDAPSAVNDTLKGVEDLGSILQVTKNDVDLDGDALMPEIVDGPGKGSAMVNSDGTISYLPIADYNGNDSFTYRVSDGIVSSSNVATVTINVEPTNDAPRGRENHVYVDAGQVVPGLLVAIEVDAGDSIAGYQFRSLTSDKGQIESFIPQTGSFNYRANSNASGTDDFLFVAIDSRGAVSEETLVRVHIRSPEQFVFVTQKNYDSKMGGLSGADSICQAEATAGGLAGVYKALLSDDNTDAKDRVRFPGAIRNLNGDVLEESEAELWDGTIKRAINIDSKANFVYQGTGQRVFTGSLGNGTRSLSNESCDNWSTTPSSSLRSIAGFVESGPASAPANPHWFTYQSSNLCDSGARLYCAEATPQMRARDVFPLTSFSVSQGTNPGDVKLDFTYPANTSAYSKIVIHRRPSKTPPGCDNTNILRELTSFGEATLTDSTGHSGIYYAYRACVYDGEGKLVSSHTGTTRSFGRSEWTNPTMPVDVDGNGTFTANDLNAFQSAYPLYSPYESLPPRPAGLEGQYYDTDDNGQMTSNDLLTIINYMNSQP